MPRSQRKIKFCPRLDILGLHGWRDVLYVGKDIGRQLGATSRLVLPYQDPNKYLCMYISYFPHMHAILYMEENLCLDQNLKY